MTVGTTPYVLGRDQRFFVEAEATFGTYVALAATDAVKLLNSTFDHQRGREPRLDNRTGRGLRSMIDGLKQNTWSLSKYLILADAAGSLDSHGVHDLLHAAFGKYTGGSSDKYEPLSSVCRTVTMMRAFATGVTGVTAGVAELHMSEMLLGAWVNSMTLRAEGGSPITPPRCMSPTMTRLIIAYV